ncbi:TIR domain-containing protein [Emticicia sp. CRIBPO]|uniref:toll/interleukin-1 receptor domain-containing protein n=1 Tax=Emticicia sp. CRIBPO TaxID=2683258 RepID=UPI00141314B9|nr:toll/interleukin-1 receptor domain-containing protein [Emticicia sp. CRIBPO]NBA89177.1 TIR domain-containing protein [Emticicia sp. CRIBPO]
MPLTDKLKLVRNTASKLQQNHTTANINILLSEYGIKIKETSFVRDKKGYVIDLLQDQSVETIVNLAKSLGLKIPESLKSLHIEVPHKADKIFISHSSLDRKIVEQIIDTLEAIGVPSDKIFCSSFEGYGVKLGSDFLETIKKELNNNVLVLFVLSTNFYASTISICEMGATWVKTNNHIPILIPPFEYVDVKGVIPTTHGMKINEKDKFNSLKEKVETLLQLPSVIPNVWERKRDKILKEINLILASDYELS